MMIAITMTTAMIPTTAPALKMPAMALQLLISKQRLNKKGKINFFMVKILESTNNAKQMF